MVFGPHTKISQDFSRASRHLRVSYAKCAVQLALFFIIQNVGDIEQGE
ncbi:hypothetical protein ES703_38653 [subsurface metagenome]